MDWAERWDLKTVKAMTRNTAWSEEAARGFCEEEGSAVLASVEEAFAKEKEAPRTLVSGLWQCMG